MSTINPLPRKKPNITWNDAGYKAWVHTGHDAEEFKGDGFLRSAVIRFMNRIDLNYAPLQQNIETIVREIGNEYDDEGNRLGNAKKEYVTYTVSYSGKDSWKQKINSGSIVEGKYTIIPQEQQVSWILQDGQPQEQIQTIDSDPVVKHTIPFSKKAVDDIIKKHNNEDRRDEIVYTVKFTDPVSRYGGYSYDEFVASEWDHLRYLANTDQGSRGNSVRARINTNALNQVCNCSKCSKEVRK